jgi:hypothetical protein
MANTDQNPIWDQVASAPGNISESVMGPSYSYAENIKGPASMGVGSRGTIGQLVTNTGAIFQYMKYMIAGPALGNQYFVNTGGSCTASDNSIQARYNYINNVSSGADVLPQAMKRDLGGIASNFDGLIPGVLEDAEGLNPVHLFTSLAADSTPTCECYTCPTSGGDQSRFLNKGLTADFNSSKCVQSEISKCIQTREGFTDRSDSAYPVLIAIGVLAILIAMK